MGGSPHYQTDARRQQPSTTLNHPKSRALTFVQAGEAPEYWAGLCAASAKLWYKWYTVHTTGPKLRLRLLTYPELPYGLPDSARAAHIACAAGSAARTRFGERTAATRTRSAAAATGWEEKCGECKMGRFPTCRGFSPAVKQKKVQKFGEATCRAATPALIMRGCIPRRANWPQPTRYPVEQCWGHEWRCQQRWSYWLAPTEGALQPPHRGRMPQPTLSGNPRCRTARQGASWGPQA